MASLISIATGNFTAAATWGTIDSVSELHSGTGTAALTTSVKSSANFIPGAAAIDGVAFKVSTLNANCGDNDTVTVLLKNVTSAGVREATVTFKPKAAMHSSMLGVTVSPGAWYFVKFASTVTPNGTDTYRLDINASSNNTLTLITNATTNNFNRMLRLTGTAAPAAGDALHMMGEIVPGSPDTYNSFTITMDNTATTSFGPTVSGGPPFGISVNNRATLAYGTAASTNYYFKFKGILSVSGGGTFTVGTASAAIPSTSTAVLEMDCAAVVDSGVSVGPGGSCEMCGATKTTLATVMTADKTATATQIAVASTSGWAASDELAFAPTGQTNTHAEKKTISTVDSATQVTLTAGLTNARSGTAPTQAEVVNLTRNVKVRGTSTTLQGYVQCQTTGSFVADYVEFLQLGNNTGTRGVYGQVTTGTFTVKHCSSHDSLQNAMGVAVTTSSTYNNVTITDNVFYSIPDYAIWFENATTGTSWVVSGNTVIRANTQQSNAGIRFADVGGTMTNNTVAASNNGFDFNDSGSVGTISGNTAHSNGANGIVVNQIGTTSSTVATLSSFSCWRNTGAGVLLNGSTRNVQIDSLLAFGNGTNGIQCFAGHSNNVLFTNATVAGDSTHGQAVGVLTSLGTGNISQMQFENCDFGVTSGIYRGHSTGDINISAANGVVDWVFRNCNFASTTELANQANMTPWSSIRSARHDKTAGQHKSWFAAGTVQIDSGEYRTAAPSEKLTPTSASLKLASGPKRAAVASGGTVTVTTYVKKSAAYNGNQPRLIVRKNVAAGISADTVLATASGGTGSYLTLTGATAAVTDDAVLEFYVDCDGTAGVVNIDDWSAA